MPIFSNVFKGRLASEQSKAPFDFIGFFAKIVKINPSNAEQSLNVFCHECQAKGGTKMEGQRFRFLQRWKDKAGREYAYFRRGGRRIPLPGMVGSSEFTLAYSAALSGDIRQREPKRGHERGTPLIGVYLLMLGGRLDYIGASMNMPERVNSHRTKGRPFDQVFYIITTANERLPLERALIRQLKPRQNKHWIRAR